MTGLGMIRRLRGLAVGMGMGVALLLLAAPGVRAAEAPRDGFISIDTVIIGCAAGAAAGALTVILPSFSVTPAASILTLLERLPPTVGQVSGIGCVVGVVSGVAAIGTAFGLELIRQLDFSTE
jgi:hypothetical protein